MSEPLSRLYDLALRTLDDQERRADALRGRLGPVLAAAALGVTLLSGPVVGGASPTSLVGKLALLVSGGGFFVAVLNAVAILASRGLRSHGVDLRGIDRQQILAETEAFYRAMIRRFSRSAARNDVVLDSLHARFTAMLYGMLVMLCGLALAALVR